MANNNTFKKKIKRVKKRLENIDCVLENPNLFPEYEQELLIQHDILMALMIRLDLEIFMADLGFSHIRRQDN
jgi:uncharacterized protein (UPF0276 family)